jgi:hypothetical protein
LSRKKSFIEATMTDLKLCVDLVDFELMHVTVVIQVMDAPGNEPERPVTGFSHFQETDGGIRMTLTEANAFIQALSLSPGIDITTPFKERTNKAQIPLQNNEPQQPANVAPAPAAGGYAPYTSATPAPHFNQATATPPREETARGISERYSTSAAQ